MDWSLGAAVQLTDLLQSLEILHRRTARIIYNLPRDMPTDEVYRHSNWNTLTFYYKLRLIKHISFLGEVNLSVSRILVRRYCGEPLVFS